MAIKSQKYDDAGVAISKSRVYSGDKITISYDGLLVKRGANEVYIHLGYGDEWEYKEYIPMEFENGVFKASIEVLTSGDLNIAFKDSAENWDNNSSYNYSFKIWKKPVKTTKEKDENNTDTKSKVLAKDSAETKQKKKRGSKSSKKASVK